MFEGKISKIVSYIPCPCGSCSGGAISDEYPAPGLKIDPIKRESETAIELLINKEQLSLE